MKINTKKCTPVLKESDVGKMNTNPCISKDKIQEEEEKEQEPYGREVLYEPEVIFTPTMSSKRTFPKPYPRLAKDAVEELTETISKMLIAGDDTSEKEEKDKPKSRAKDPIVSKPLGRYEAEVFTKSKTVVRVTRSLRLTA